MTAESGAMVTEAAEMGGLVVAESHEAWVGEGRRSDEVEAGAERLLLRDVRERLHERAGGCEMRRHDQREAGRDEDEAGVVHYYGAKVVRARRRRRASTGTFEGGGLIIGVTLDRERSRWGLVVSGPPTPMEWGPAP